MNVITWNMQGATGFGENKWRTDVARLFNRGAQICLLQECGNPPPSALPIPAPPVFGGAAVPGGINWNYYSWNIGSRRHPCTVGIFWLETDPAGHRVNLAIATVIFAGVPGAVVPNGIMYVPPAGGIAAARPAIGIRIPFGGGNANIFTLHALAGGGGDAPALITNINGGGAPWFAAGDMNRLPATWGAVALPGGVVGCPNSGDPTHPGTGTNLDYGFANGIAPAAAGLVMSDFVVSDHYPVYYVI